MRRLWYKLTIGISAVYILLSVALVGYRTKYYVRYGESYVRRDQLPDTTPKAPAPPPDSTPTAIDSAPPPAPPPAQAPLLVWQHSIAPLRVSSRDTLKQLPEFWLLKQRYPDDSGKAE